MWQSPDAPPALRHPVELARAWLSHYVDPAYNALMRAYACSVACLTLFSAIAVVACSANNSDGSSQFSSSGGSGGSVFNTGGGGSGGTGGSGGSGGVVVGDGGGGSAGGDDCSDNAKKIFVVSQEDGLYTFDPTISGMAAYTQLGTLNCNPNSSPQTMGVDRSGNAWVFYSAGQLYKVATNAGALTCTPTPYVHPDTSGGPYTLGMGFTAASPGSTAQVFYMISDTFGLASIDLANNFAVSMTGALQGVSAELTGGPDGKLFTYEAGSGRLSEILVSSGFAMQTITTLGQIAGASAWAFSRYAGVFYIFTGDGIFGGSQCSRFDPSTNSFQVRDSDVGFTVVGAGQSTCVPPPAPK